MATMKAVQVGKAGGDFEVVERPIPQPARAQVRISRRVISTYGRLVHGPSKVMARPRGSSGATCSRAEM